MFPKAAQTLTETGKNFRTFPTLCLKAKLAIVESGKM